MPDYGLNAGIPATPVGLPDKEYNLLLPLYQAINNLAQNVSNISGFTTYDQVELAQQNQLQGIRTQNATRLAVKADGDLDYGKIVNLFLDGGKITAQYADATDATKPAHGIVNAPLGIDDGMYGDVLLFTGFSNGITGTAVGTIYYLDVAGDVSSSRPGAAGSIIQAIGIGLGSAGFYLNISSLFIQN